MIMDLVMIKITNNSLVSVVQNCCGFIVREESRWRINKKFRKNKSINR